MPFSCKRLSVLAVAFCAGLAPAAAQALSCLQPDPVADFLQAKESDDIWIVVDGVLDFDETRLPRTDLSNQSAPKRTDIPARIEGTSLTLEGFTLPFSKEITLRALCFGPWCGRATSSTRYMTFLKQEGDVYVMPVDPCGNRAYPDPTQAMRDSMTRCLQGKACTPKNPR